MTDEQNPFAALERIFHEPSRLQILSTLASAPKGLSFPELKAQVGLTDGNLSRHLKALETLGVIRQEKTFVNLKPRTTVFLSEEGREKFLGYLQSLEKVLKAAREAAAPKTSPGSMQSEAEPA
jgi:DNA-binding MarR family transcriptional regulator